MDTMKRILAAGIIGCIGIGCGLSEAQDDADAAERTLLFTLWRNSQIKGVCSISGAGGVQSQCIEYRGSYDADSIESHCNVRNGASAAEGAAGCSNEDLQGTCDSLGVIKVFYYSASWPTDTAAENDCLSEFSSSSYNAEP